MADSDESTNMDTEDIAALEDNPSEGKETDVITGAGEGGDFIAPDMPIYRLRLSYSQETFLAVYKGDRLAPRSMVIVPTRYGRDLAEVIGPVRPNNAPSASDIAWIERPASSEDLERARHNREQEKEAFRIGKEMIEENNSEMKLVQVHYLLEGPKILFFFTADNRVDFRELVKDLASVFKTRIELRQIGVRDEARMVGGLGVCGRGYCCHTVSDKIRSVSIKMAKDQNLSPNSMKISGPCDRLLCCLSYENAYYCEQQRLMPPEGAWINYDNASWKVNEVNVITEQLKLSCEDGRLITLPSSRFEKADNRWRVKPAERN